MTQLNIYIYNLLHSYTIMSVRQRANAICANVAFVVKRTQSNLVGGERVQFVMVAAYCVHLNRFHGQRTQRMFVIGECEFCVFHLRLHTLCCILPHQRTIFLVYVAVQFRT